MDQAILKGLFAWFTCMCLCVNGWQMRAGACGGQERTAGTLALVTGACELPCEQGCWELNLGYAGTASVPNCWGTL